MKLIEHREKAQGLGDLLLYDTEVDDGVMLLQDGSLLSAWEFNGPDMDSRTHAEMAALAARLNRLLCQGAGWMFHCDAIRTKAPGYSSGEHFPEPVSLAIDEERRAQFGKEGVHFESKYRLVMTYQPAAEKEERLGAMMFTGGDGKSTSALRTLNFFKRKAAYLDESLGSLFHVARLKRVKKEQYGEMVVHNELLQYIRAAVTGIDHPFAQPEIPTCLQDVIACEDFVGGVEQLRMGKKHIRVLAIDGFPRMSHPGILRALDSLPVEYRWNTRAILLDPREAVARIDGIRKRWRQKVRGWMDVIFNRDGPINLYAHEMEVDAHEAMSVAQKGDVHFVFYSSNVILMEEDPARLEENVGLARKTIQSLGFSCRVETVNAVEALRGTWPGDGYHNVRRVLLHTQNLADMLPVSSVWAGLAINPSPLMPPNTPPLMYAATTGNTPYRHNLHATDDVFHSVWIGPTGSGKSTALAIQAAQWLRYPNSRVIVFDKGYSMFTLTNAVGGDFYDIGNEEAESLSFCPLQDIDSDADVTWAVGWLETLAKLNGVVVTAHERSALLDAVRKLQESPARTMTELVANVQETHLREALAHYTLTGPLGGLFDADRDMISESNFICFEMQHLFGMGAIAGAALLPYLFHRIIKRLLAGKGEPTLIVLDEAWKFLGHEMFREMIEQWLRTLRVLNAGVLMATQSLSDLFNSPIKDVLLESTATKVLLPNIEADKLRHLYEALGCNEREIEIIANARRKAEYYITSANGCRLVNFGLGPVALAFCGVSGPENRLAVKALIDQYGSSRWPAEWLRRRGQSDWATWLEGCSRIREEPAMERILTASGDRPI